MTVREFLAALEKMPDSLRDLPLTMFSTDDGRKFSIRDDVSQFNLYMDTIQTYVREVK